MTAHTDAQWSAMSKIVQGFSQRQDAGMSMMMIVIAQ
jgi:hypothetical protein